MLRAFLVLESDCGEVQDAAAIVTADNMFAPTDVRKHSSLHLLRHCFHLLIISFLERRYIVTSPSSSHRPFFYYR